MMKKIISTTLLLAAGTAFSNAAIVYTTSLSSGSSNNGNYYGFTLKLTDAFMSTTQTGGSETMPDNVYLTGVELFSRTSGTQSAVNVKLAIYAFSSDGTTGTFVALSDAVSVPSSTNQSFTFNFDGAQISKNQRYQMLFVANTATASSVSSFDGYKAAAQQVGLNVLNQNSLPRGDGTYKNNTLNSWEGFYLPKVTITTTDSAVPEPSAFGLLAGLGALALVASRRRRSRK